MLCFSYGSNMSLRRLQNRVKSAQFIAVATLPAHRLKFHKVSKKDCSGKCDAEATGNANDKVVGVIYEVSDEEKLELDKQEGLWAGYDEKEVQVVAEHGKVACMMYFATNVDATLKPYRWYKEHVLAGARENGLPPEYIAQIEAVEALEDPVSARSERELSIYR